jgi:hypothetical protein
MSDLDPQKLTAHLEKQIVSLLPNIAAYFENLHPGIVRTMVEKEVKRSYEP